MNLLKTKTSITANDIVLLTLSAMVIGISALISGFSVIAIMFALLGEREVLIHFMQFFTSLAIFAIAAQVTTFAVKGKTNKEVFVIYSVMILVIILSSVVFSHTTFGIEFLFNLMN